MIVFYALQPDFHTYMYLGTVRDGRIEGDARLQRLLDTKDLRDEDELLRAFDGPYVVASRAPDGQASLGDRLDQIGQHGA